MRILLVGGFLGSGKTSTILQVARQLTAAGETVAIIENEIGEAGIDDQLLADSGLTVKPLFGGCVCCQITGDLLQAIGEIETALAPGWLIVEMTGMAVPRTTASLVRKYCPGRACKVITLVDGGRWFELREALEPLVIAQLEGSDLIIVNKTDIAGSLIDDICADIDPLIGRVPVVRASAAGTLPPGIVAEVLRIG
jgi:G3E family GTPase